MEQERKPRMLLLLRNSSKKQAEKIITDDGRTEYDIPLQRNILRPWAERQGYEIIGELVEGGISGFKLSASQRDAVVELKAMADRGEFDVLGIYMSDRLGRIADETPLIVSYLNARGIKVLSYTDGFISTETHEDKFMTYFRFWMAEGESIKTSKRVKDAHESAVEQGRWRGGCPPYGYKTVSNGRLNGKGRPIFDVEIDEDAAAVVKRIFTMYLEHIGTRNIAKTLNTAGIPAFAGGLWDASAIAKILKNKLYLGIYELGKKGKKVKKESPIMEHLRFIDEKTFYEVQERVQSNSHYPKGHKRKTARGSKLLSGLLYCECGQKYTGHTYKGVKIRASGAEYVYEHSFYRCGSHRHPIEGQCTKKPFASDKIDSLIIFDAKKFLLEVDIEKLLVTQEDRIREKEQEIVEHLRRLAKEIAQKEKELQKYKEEVYKVIIGESSFTQELLSELIQVKERELADLRKKCDEADARAEELRKTLRSQRAVCGSLTELSERFDLQETMEKKAMLINLIEQVTIFDEEIEVQ